MRKPLAVVVAALAVLLLRTAPAAGVEPVTLPGQRGTIDAERFGTHDAARIRTRFWNYGMVGDYPPDPGHVDLTSFHSMEVPKGSGMNYSDGVTPFVLARVQQRDGTYAYIMETGYRERQGISPLHNRVMRFEPRPGFIQPDAGINKGRSPAISNDPRTWPNTWPDKGSDWDAQWNGYFGKRPAADQESFTVMDDDYYDAWDFFPDARDTTRRGLGLRVEVRGFQWANPQAGNVIFWHYDITNEGTTDYDDIVFGLYMDSGVGGSALSCDGVYESDDDNAFFDKSFGLNLVYTWDKFGHGVDLSGLCGKTGYLGYAYLETPGNPYDGIDNDNDGITDERRDSGPGTEILGQANIRAYWAAHYDTTKFIATYGPLEKRIAYRRGVWWTGDEDMDWDIQFDDVGADGVAGTNDAGEGDGIPTSGEPNFDKTDLHESDQIGLTGFKMSVIKCGAGTTGCTADNVVFFTDSNDWPHRLYQKFVSPESSSVRFDPPLATNGNIAFLFASGPFRLPVGDHERFSLALAFGQDLNELRNTVKVVQTIYNANYQFAVPPPLPVVTAESGDGYVRLSWTDLSERAVDPVTHDNDFEGYRIYRATDPEFRDPQIVPTGSNQLWIPNGKPTAQFDLVDGKFGWSKTAVEGVQYYLGSETGITHTWVDTTVSNGQQYYYAVCSYDFGFDPGLGSDSLAFFPSENSIAVSRTARGGVILPSNVVSVIPEPKVPGYQPPTVAAPVHAKGSGTGSVSVQIVNSSLVQDSHLYAVRFAAAPESVHAATYALIDSTAHKVLFSTGHTFDSTAVGPVGGGLLPIVDTGADVKVDTVRTGFRPGTPTTAHLLASYEPSLPFNLRRPGYPDDISITFYDHVVDTSIAAVGLPARPAKFLVIAHTATGDIQLNFRFFEQTGSIDSTISAPGEFIEILTYAPSAPNAGRPTWYVELDHRFAVQAPVPGDVWDLKLTKPLGSDDVYTFTATGQKIDAQQARTDFQNKVYVVPNPYVAAASFEPQRFAVSGRGERKVEFRGLPQNATIRIYTVRGDLVQTLRQNGSNDAVVAWNLRTKDNLDVAPGLYIFEVEAHDVGKQIGKFALIK